MIVLSFQQPLIAGLYIVSMFLLGLHLSHGVSSLFQTLGFNHPKYRNLVGSIGPFLGVLLALGFSSIPAAVLFGLLK
jgi:succinate dehydrogenase / fumarate reductase cytochrome b subunit